MTNEAQTPLVHKFWIHDPPKEGQKGQKGHPRTLIAFWIHGGVVTFAHTTWNPDRNSFDPEPFDRTHAIKRVEGRLACSKRNDAIAIGSQGVHKSILVAMATSDRENNRTNTARYEACCHAMCSRTFKNIY